MPAAVTLGAMWSPPHPSLGAGQMLLLDSWTLWQGWGVPQDLVWQEMELGLWQGPNPRPRGLLCLPSPALPGDLPLLTITHTQPHLAWHGDTSGPSPCLRTSPPIWDVPIPSDPVLDRPCVGSDLTAALGGPLWHPCPICSLQGPAPALWALPPYPGLMEGISPNF